jgi:hypothetical protein
VRPAPRAYDHVVETLTTLASLYDHVGRGDKFHALVAGIRTAYKRRRNLIARMDRAGL